jgi:hypothetical protein
MANSKKVSKTTTVVTHISYTKKPVKRNKKNSASKVINVREAVKDIVPISRNMSLSKKLALAIIGGVTAGVTWAELSMYIKKNKPSLAYQLRL